MDFDHQKKVLSINTAEPFGGVLIEQMYRQYHTDTEESTLAYIGSVLAKKYFEDIFDNIGLTKLKIHDDIAKDISQKIIIHALSNPIDIEFSEEYFDGLEMIAMNRAEELRELEAELKVTELASEINYVNFDGVAVDSQDIDIISEEIEQAKAAKIALDIIRKSRGKDS